MIDNLFGNAFILSVIGIFATLFTLYSIIPQIRKARNTRKAEDVSLTFIVIRFIGLLLWTIYGVYTHDVIFIAGSVLGSLLTEYMIILKTRYSKKKLSINR